MARTMRRTGLAYNLQTHMPFETNLENFKRKRALAASNFVASSKAFFERMLEVKKTKDFIFFDSRRG